jgi:hypothetical protein
VTFGRAAAKGSIGKGDQMNRAGTSKTTTWASTSLALFSTTMLSEVRETIDRQYS